MKIGRLRHRITFEQVSETQDMDGAVLESRFAYAVVHASVEPISGREYFAAQSTQADVTHRISLRYLPGVTPKMRVNYGSRIFDILSVTKHSRYLIRLPFSALSSGVEQTGVFLHCKKSGIFGGARL